MRQCNELEATTNQNAKEIDSPSNCREGWSSPIFGQLMPRKSDLKPLLYSRYGITSNLTPIAHLRSCSWLRLDDMYSSIIHPIPMAPQFIQHWFIQRCVQYYARQYPSTAQKPIESEVSSLKSKPAVPDSSGKRRKWRKRLAKCGFGGEGCCFYRWRR